MKRRRLEAQGKTTGRVVARDDRNRIKFRRNFRFRPVLPGFGFVRPFFAHFCPFFAQIRPNSPVFCPVSPRFRPNSPGFGFIRFLPKFSRIRSDSFVVRNPDSAKPGRGGTWVKRFRMLCKCCWSFSCRICLTLLVVECS